MTRRMPPLLRTALMLNLFALFLLFVAANWPLPGEGSRKLKDTDALVVEEASVAQAQDVSGILERPLFHENRRAAQSPKIALTAAPIQRDIEPPFNLVGILGSQSGGRTAYLFNKNSQETVSAKVDQQAGGWLVVQIETDSVTIEAEGVRRKLDMQN